jgi:transaldolase
VELVKIFLDSADLDEIKEAYDYGIVDGITTNPSLIKKAVEKRISQGQKIDMKSYINEILKTAKGTPVSLEVTETTEKGMLRQARKIYSMFNNTAKNVVMKIPINSTFSDSEKNQFDGLKVIKQLTKENIPVNCTLIFTPEQALLASKAGAKYVSPFAGRVDDDLREKAKIKFDKSDYYPFDGMDYKKKTLEDNGIISGIDLVDQCVTILENYNLKTEVLAASIRNPRQAREAALSGSHIATLPIEVIRKMITHPKTQEGMQKFTKDIVLEYMDLLK